MIFDFTYPLELQKIFVNTFAGSIGMFAYIAIIVLSMLAAYFRMPGYLVLIMISIFIIMFAPIYEGIWILVILLVGVAVFYWIKNLTSK